MNYKFAFDTSAIDSQNVQKLKNAGIKKACESGKLAFFLTPILLEQTLDFLTREKYNTMHIDNIKFLLDLKRQHFLRHLTGENGIFFLELQGQSLKNKIFYDKKEEEQFINHISVIINDPASINQNDKNQLSDIKKEWKDDFKLIYNEDKLAREEIKKLGRNLGENSKFNYFYKNHFENFINDQLSQIEKRQKLTNFSYSKKSCPFFYKFMKGMLYGRWYAMINHNKKIDKDNVLDIHHLVYLKELDSIISNDKKFMKDACKELFPTKGFLTVDEFIKKIKSS